MAAVDPFASVMPTPRGPYNNAAVITPHNTNELANVTSAIFVGGAGGLKVTMAGSGTVTFAAVPDGFTLPIRAKIVFNTGTAATDLVALW